jgi:hypothetical protein
MFGILGIHATDPVQREVWHFPYAGSTTQESLNPGITTTEIIDYCHGRLHRAGWSVGEVRIATATGPARLVSGSNGENRIDARGATQGEAWSQAVAQARALGMLDGGRRFFVDRR